MTTPKRIENFRGYKAIATVMSSSETGAEIIIASNDNQTITLAAKKLGLKNPDESRYQQVILINRTVFEPPELQ
jgi:hypothetical protein